MCTHAPAKPNPIKSSFIYMYTTSNGVWFSFQRKTLLSRSGHLHVHDLSPPCRAAKQNILIQNKYRVETHTNTTHAHDTVCAHSDLLLAEAPPCTHTHTRYTQVSCSLVRHGKAYNKPYMCMGICGGGGSAGAASVCMTVCMCVCGVCVFNCLAFTEPVFPSVCACTYIWSVCMLLMCESVVLCCCVFITSRGSHI